MHKFTNRVVNERYESILINYLYDFNYFREIYHKRFIELFKICLYCLSV